jgi:hypothetical protein
MAAVLLLGWAVCCCVLPRSNQRQSLSHLPAILYVGAAVGPFWVRPLLLAVDKVLALQWLMARAIAGLDNEAAAMVRMTAAVTNIQAGVADNVMPQVRFGAYLSPRLQPFEC